MIEYLEFFFFFFLSVESARNTACKMIVFFLDIIHFLQ